MNLSNRAPLSEHQPPAPPAERERRRTVPQYLPSSGRPWHWSRRVPLRTDVVDDLVWQVVHAGVRAAWRLGGGEPISVRLTRSGHRPLVVDEAENLTTASLPRRAGPQRADSGRETVHVLYGFPGELDPAPLTAEHRLVVTVARPEPAVTVTTHGGTTGLSIGQVVGVAAAVDSGTYDLDELIRAAEALDQGLSTEEA